jgi:glycosyltransferase involved in cell wall biosynthesis
VNRICVIRQYYFPQDQRVRNQVQALVTEGHEVDVICMRRPGQPRLERDGRLTIRRLPLLHRRAGKLRYLFEYAAFFALAMFWVTALHLRQRYRIVAVHSLPDALVFAAIVAKLLGAKIVLDLHETMPEFFATKFGVTMRYPAVRAISWLEQASIRLADFTVTCNDQMRQRFVERGADPDRIGVVMGSADETVFKGEWVHPAQPALERFTIISHGTIEERYGLDTAVRAVALLKDEIPELRLNVHGEGPQEVELRVLAQRLGVDDRVSFDGYVPLDNLLRAINEADAGLIATKRDEFRDLIHCLKMFEFVSMKKPVICSRTPAVEACFDEESFLYFIADDERDLARAIKRLYVEQDLGDRLVAHATAANNAYRWPRQREVYLSLMRQVFEGQLAPTRTPDLAGR